MTIFRLTCWIGIIYNWLALFLPILYRTKLPFVYRKQLACVSVCACVNAIVIFAIGMFSRDMLAEPYGILHGIRYTLKIEI